MYVYKWYRNDRYINFLFFYFILFFARPPKVSVLIFWYFLSVTYEVTAIFLWGGYYKWTWVSIKKGKKFKKKIFWPKLCCHKIKKESYWFILRTFTRMRIRIYWMITEQRAVKCLKKLQNSCVRLLMIRLMIVMTHSGSRFCTFFRVSFNFFVKIVSIIYQGDCFFFELRE